MPAPSNIIPGIHYVWRVVGVGCRMSGVSGGRVPGYGGFRYWFWHCSWHRSRTVLGTGLAPAWPLRCPVYALAQPGAVRASQWHPGTSCTPGTPCTPPHPTRHAVQPWRAVRWCRGARGAQSWLHPWTDWPGSSSAPLDGPPWPR